MTLDEAARHVTCSDGLATASLAGQVFTLWWFSGEEGQAPGVWVVIRLAGQSWQGRHTEDASLEQAVKNYTELWSLDWTKGSQPKEEDQQQEEP